MGWDAHDLLIVFIIITIIMIIIITIINHLRAGVSL